MKIKELLFIFNEVKKQEEAMKKQKELDALSATPINYGIIRDLVNSASYGVIITVSFPDGTKLDIKRDDPMNNPYRVSENF